MDLFLNMIMKLGGFGVGIVVFFAAVYAYALSSAKKSVEPEREPGDTVHTMPVEDDNNANYHGVK